ncbi:MAG: VanW family protein [Clostridiales bacterium]|nr:VanW family protein [Clostridiales bacterium]
MKKTVTLFLFLAICLFTLPGHGMPLQYRATTTTDFQLRGSPQEDGKRMLLVNKRREVNVVEHGDEWSKIIVNSKTGYAKSKWLSKYISLDPIAYQIPGYPKQIGIAKIAAPVSLSVPGYSGNTLSTGDLIAIRSLSPEQACVNMMRDVAQLPANALSFTAFVPWEAALPGDIISGFTTFFNEKTGGKKLAANRAYNIGLASERLQAVIIGAQESFSYNSLCAPYKKSNGYLMAPNISRDGEGYGGGVCQLTTTLYNAALGLPLRIDEWEVHRERGVAYIPQYFDAAVGSYSDLVFTNLLPYAISLEVLTQNGALTVSIHRASELN